MVIERGDLDFTEQLWEKMRKSNITFGNFHEIQQNIFTETKL